MINDEFIKDTIEKIRNNPSLTIKNVMDLSVNQWVQKKCEDTLRIHYYNTNSLDKIIDVGSYDGKWANKFLNYHKDCTLYCYEPAKRFFENSKVLLSHHLENKRVFLKNAGLSNKTEKSVIDDSLELAAKTGVGSEKIKLLNIKEEIENLGEIYLLKMNIEGGEYNCLPLLCESGIISKINNLQIQFHPLNTKEETLERYENIVDLLSATHKVDYFFPFIWENWSRR